MLSGVGDRIGVSRAMIVSGCKDGLAGSCAGAGWIWQDGWSPQRGETIPKFS